MSHDHSHGGGSATTPHRRRLAVAFVLVSAFFVVELLAGVMSGSLALLSDAGHMAGDVVTLGAALVATRLALRPDTTGRRTFGSYRAEVFASGIAVLVMLAVGGYIAVEAVHRLGGAAEPTSSTMLVVGLIGLVINLICLLLLRAGSGESLTVKGAYLEVVADSLGSVGVIVAGAMVAWTSNGWWDTGIALAIAVFVIVRAVSLGREVVQVLGQHAPAGAEPASITASLRAIAGVAEVHDLHVWRLTSGMDVATAHVVTAPGASAGQVLDEAGRMLREHYSIAHATLQVEAADRGCQRTGW